MKPVAHLSKWMAFADREFMTIVRMIPEGGHRFEHRAFLQCHSTLDVSDELGNQLVIPYR
jgi:hypothetical protein